MKLKIGIDVGMTIVLLFLMAYQITENVLHEWLGTGMLILFFVHNFLNIHWYRNLFKGKYGGLRIIQTVINLAVLVSMFCLAYSGIVMSRHVFVLLDFHKGMTVARVMHLSASYWGFVLMSIHMGNHFGMIIGMIRQVVSKKIPISMICFLRFQAIAIAVYGAIVFWRNDVLSYMFLQKEFAFFDYEKGAVLVVVENMAMMGMWMFVAYYVTKVIKKLKRNMKGNF